ncbi:uncharacterized protein LOC118186127 [Stegodyphus dumicola]|uniref:uncharacterized protein LOC118186127 n=1 Tax=Stegodyphus dumicola TaxID=202533 RepID=UPI0015ADFDBA|nr:uncharacterized protein LOC118186127 [Stegodyphus dumicola]
MNCCHQNQTEVLSQIFATLYDYPALKNCEGLKHYVKDCVRLAWSLSNQYPSFIIEYDARTFRRDLHVRFHSSNQESDHIKTYLWPTLLEGRNGPCVHKGVCEIKECLDAVYGDSSPSMATVKNWFNKFQRGRTSVFDEPCPGASKTATTEDNVTKAHDLVLADRQFKVRKIAETVGISKDRVGHILHEILGMRKLSARWVLRLLTPDNKRIHETTSEQCLTLFKRNPKEFLRRFTIVDETWIHWYTPETKDQSKQWTLPGECAPKKAKTVPSAAKVMATVFWVHKV